jgi:hypothetical protein
MRPDSGQFDPIGGISLKVRTNIEAARKQRKPNSGTTESTENTEEIRKAR